MKKTKKKMTNKHLAKISNWLYDVNVQLILNSSIVLVNLTMKAAQIHTEGFSQSHWGWQHQPPLHHHRTQNPTPREHP